ncbi:MAG: DNA polymerase sliding clamp [Desulfurococcus sp.]|nr:DNA polymerase sliding clamp [Desulfurococcus sp.]
MARLVLPEAKVFKEIIGAVGKLADEVALRITGEGVSLKALDIDQSSYIEVLLPSDMFLEYNVSEEEIVGVSTSNLKKVLKNLKKGENLIVESSGDYVSFTVGAIARRVYRFRNLEVSLPEIPEFNLEFNASAQLTSSSIKKILEDAESVSSVVEIDASSSDMLVFRAKGTGKVEVKLTLGSLALISLDVKKPSKSTYDIAKLSTVLGLTSISDTVLLELSDKAPLKLEFKIGSGRVTYLLAPIEEG